MADFQGRTLNLPVFPGFIDGVFVFFHSDLPVTLQPCHRPCHFCGEDAKKYFPLGFWAILLVHVGGIWGDGNLVPLLGIAKLVPISPISL